MLATINRRGSGYRIIRPAFQNPANVTKTGSAQ